MSNELELTYTGSRTPYVVARRSSDGYAWNGSAFVAWNDSNIDDYEVSMSNLEGDYWAASIPSGISTGVRYTFIFYLKDGASPATDDLIADRKSFVWNGVNVDESSSSVTIDETVGGSSSNSYVTLTEANNYMATRSHANDWITSSDADLKARCLITATKMLDDLEFRYTKYDVDVDWSTGLYDQALEFPRSVHVLNDGSTYIPIEVKEAQYEQALYLFRLHNNGQEIDEQQSIRSFSRGSVRVEYGSRRTSVDSSQGNISPLAMNRIKKFLAPSRGIELVR